MPRLSLYARLILATLALTPAIARADKPLNLLFFGNSFTQRSNVPELVKQVAIADGHPAPCVVASMEGGKNLEYHLKQVAEAPQENVAHPDIAGDTWDFVLIQAHSIEPTHLRNPDGFRANVDHLYATVRDHSSGRGAGVTAILYQTWARARGHQFYPEVYEAPAEMQAEISQQYRLAVEQMQGTHGREAVRLAPVGDAFEAFDFDALLYGRDLYHAAPKGSLLAALVLYRTAYDEQVSDIAYASVEGWAKVDAETWQRLVEFADAAVIDTPE